MHWFEDEDFWRDLYPVMFPDERMAAAVDQVRQILDLTHFQGHTVLDLCCGPGRHAVELARQGLAVTGVDRSPYLLELARERASQFDVAVDWVEQDMRDFRRPAAFDLVCNLFTSFGYFEGEEDDLRVLRNVRESLKPGGVLVMEMLGKERLAHNWVDAICIDYPGGFTLLQRPRMTDGWSRVQNEWLLLKDGHYRTFRFAHWVYSGRELKDRLIASGFEQVELFGDLAGSPYGPNALRLIAIAKAG